MLNELFDCEPWVKRLRHIWSVQVGRGGDAPRKVRKVFLGCPPRWLFPAWVAMEGPVWGISILAFERDWLWSFSILCTEKRCGLVAQRENLL